MKRVSQRELNKQALREAAAIIESEDFTSLFGDDVCDEWVNDEIMDDRMDKAHRYVVDRIRSLIKEPK
jgi:hypothetical protein